MDAVNRVIRAIALAEAGQSSLPPAVLGLPGMSSPKVRHFLSNLASDRYLEVGVWAGSTFVSACYGRRLSAAVAVDNFSQLLRDDVEIQDLFHGHVAQFLVGQPITLDTRSFFDVPKNDLPRDVDVYFYDGDHSQASQRRAIEHAWESVASEAIIIVDDANWEGVRDGTREGFAAVGATPVREWLLPARHNGDTEQWWNGLYVAVIRK